MPIRNAACGLIIAAWFAAPCLMAYYDLVWSGMTSEQRRGARRAAAKVGLVFGLSPILALLAVRPWMTAGSFGVLPAWQEVLYIVGVPAWLLGLCFWVELTAGRFLRANGRYSFGRLYSPGRGPEGGLVFAIVMVQVGILFFGGLLVLALAPGRGR